MPFVVDQDPVGALGSCCAYPSLGIAVRAWRPRRALYYPHALGSEDAVERTRELGVAVPDEEAERANPVFEVHEQVAGLLGGPGTVRVGGHAQDVHVPGRHFHHEQHIQACQQNRVHMEEIAGQEPVCLSTQERAPGRVRFPRGRSAPPGAQDPPHGRLADVVTEPAHLAVHPAVPPGRVLACQPQHQIADLLAGAGAAWPAGTSTCA